MNHYSIDAGKTIAKVYSAASCKILLALVLSSLAMPCLSQAPKMERLFQVSGSKFPEVMVRWTLKNGCFYYGTGRADFLDEMERYKKTYEWSGECIAGQPLNGYGDLLGLSINFQGELIPHEIPEVGRMVNGRWEGVVRRGKDSYTYRNGCIGEFLCRNLFNQLDASLAIQPKAREQVLVPVRQADAPASPVKPSPALAPTPQGRRLTPENAVLKPPKGYEHIKSAQLYTFDIGTLANPQWIVAKSKAEAIQIGERLYSGYGGFNDCMAGRRNDCLNHVELKFGWFAFITSARPGVNDIGVYVGYAAPSRQAAIDGALSVYRENRANNGHVMQSLEVGLTSEINWSRIEQEQKESYSKKDKSGLVAVMWKMNQLNYKTLCEWYGERSRNTDPEPLKGTVDADPKCKKLYRPDEKMPEPVLTVGR